MYARAQNTPPLLFFCLKLHLSHFGGETQLKLCLFSLACVEWRCSFLFLVRVDGQLSLLFNHTGFILINGKQWVEVGSLRMNASGWGWRLCPPGSFPRLRAFGHVHWSPACIQSMMLGCLFQSAVSESLCAWTSTSQLQTQTPHPFWNLII